MVSRRIIRSLVAAAAIDGAGAVKAASSLRRTQRTSNQAAVLSSKLASEDNDIVDISRTRSLQDDASNSTVLVNSTDPTNSTDQTDTADTILIPSDCLNLLAASANENGKVKKENYFVFTDGMSNGYYTVNNMTSYSDLPFENKFGFVTLACQCHSQGGKGNCCQGDRAKLDVTGIDEDDPDSMPAQLRVYVKDICSTTSSAVGDNKLPPTGELPTTPSPTTSLPPSLSPTPSPTTSRPSVLPSYNPSYAPTVQEVVDAGLPFWAWVGIAFGGVFVVTLAIHSVTESNKERDPAAVDDLVLHSPRDDDKKESRALTNEEELESDSPPSSPGGDQTFAMTGSVSDVSSLPSSGVITPGSSNNSPTSQEEQSSSYYSSHPLLPKTTDEEELMQVSSNEDVEAGIFTGSGVDLGVPLDGPQSDTSGPPRSILKTSGSSEASSTSSLDHAIESGNWEAVAASAASIVKQNGSSH